MLRQERFKSGPADQKNLDEEFARAIATDGGFAANLDYMDDNAERLGRKKMRSDAMKRQFAINGVPPSRNSSSEAEVTLQITRRPSKSLLLVPSAMARMTRRRRRLWWRWARARI